MRTVAHERFIWIVFVLCQPQRGMTEDKHDSYKTFMGNRPHWLGSWQSWWLQVSHAELPDLVDQEAICLMPSGVNHEISTCLYLIVLGSVTILRSSGGDRPWDSDLARPWCRREQGAPLPHRSVYPTETRRPSALWRECHRYAAGCLGRGEIR